MRSRTTPTSRVPSGPLPRRSEAMRTIGPMRSSRTSRCASTRAGLHRSTCPTAPQTPASSHACIMTSASWHVAAIGFSTRTWMPALANAIVACACVIAGVATSAMSTVRTASSSPIEPKTSAGSATASKRSPSGSTAPTSSTRGEACSTRA